MNLTIARLTTSALLGRRRALLLVILPATLLGLAILVRVVAGPDAPVGQPLLHLLAIGTMVPLLGLIAGAGVIGSEIDEGSIIYLLAKPVPRSVIVVTKLAVAVVCLLTFAALPTFVAGVIMSGRAGDVAIGFGLGAALAGVGYAAVFLLLAVVTRHAVVFGLAYALIWESFVGGFVPRAQMLSIQQWALAVVDKVVRQDEIEAVMGVFPALLLLVVVTVVATCAAGLRLRSLSLTESP
mgnify:CR=1 FL=1|jgi:ABC-2 type transport system permease protein